MKTFYLCLPAIAAFLFIKVLLCPQSTIHAPGFSPFYEESGPVSKEDYLGKTENFETDNLTDKSEFIAFAQARLHQVDNQMSNLAKDMRVLKNEDEISILEIMMPLYRQRNAAKQYLDALKHSDSQDWKALGSKVSTALIGIENGIKLAGLPASRGSTSLVKVSNSLCPDPAYKYYR